MNNYILKEALEYLRNDTMKFKFNHKGYFQNEFLKRDIDSKMELFNFLFNSDIILSKRVKLDKLTSSIQECSECGEKYLFLYNDGIIREVQLNKNEETICNPILLKEIEIDFPSGILIYDDCLPYSYKVLDELSNNMKHSLNSKKGKIELTNKYANKNILHLYSGDTSPAIYKKNNTLVISEVIDNENSPCRCGRQNCDCEYEEYLPIENSIKIGDTITDVHWISLVDFEIYKNLLIDFYGYETANKYIKEIETLKTTITPGKYKCYNYYKNDSIICVLKLM